MAGRPRKPYRLKVLEGGRGKRPTAPDLPAPKDPLARPAGLSRAESAAWTRHAAWVKQLGIESSVDSGVFEAMVRAYCKARDAETLVRKHGLTFASDSGNVHARPEVAIARESWRLYQQLANQYGLTPSARAKLGATTLPTDPESAGDVPPELRDAKRR